MGLKTSGELSLPSAAPAAEDLIRLNPMKYSKISTQCTVSRNARTDSRICKGVCVCFCYHAMIFLFFVVLLCTLISDEKYKFYFIYLHAPHIKYEYDHGIEEVWKQKPRQTVVVVLWGKIAAHLASIKTV